jgi:hypothetical protein
MDDPGFNGFPVWPGAALKAAQDVGGREVTAGSRRFDSDPADAERLTRFLRARLPAALGVHSWSASAPPTASSSPRCSAACWPTSPCTAAPRWTSTRSTLGGPPSPPPTIEPNYLV